MNRVRKQPKEPISAIEAVERARGAGVRYFYEARELFDKYFKNHCSPRPVSLAEGRYEHDFALAAVYECGIIEGKRQERARRKRKAVKT